MNFQCFQRTVIFVLMIIFNVSFKRNVLSSHVTDSVIAPGNVQVEKNIAPNEAKNNSETLLNVNGSEILKNINSSILESQRVSTFQNNTVYYPKWVLNIKSGALQRTGLVTLGIMSAVVLFFIVRAVRVRHRRSKSRKYGVISSTASEMEMEPLEGRGGDDDEEETLFDAQQKYLIK